jgi:hypothetical protein
MLPELFGPAHDGSGAGEVPVIERLGNELATARKNMAELLRHAGEQGICRGCSAEIYWVVHRNKKPTPYNPDGTNHFGSCKNRELFRRRTTNG